MKARELVVAPRMPRAPAVHTGNPFTSEGDMVVDCTVEGCGWHAMGPRSEIKLAVNEHHRLFHPNETSTILLNQPKQ